MVNKLFLLRKVMSFGSGFLIAIQLWVVTSVYAASPSRDSVTTQISGLVSGFEEPLVRTAPTSSQENEALLNGIESYESRSRVDDLRAFDVFLSDYPHSGWRVAVLTNLGLHITTTDTFLKLSSRGRKLGRRDAMQIYKRPKRWSIEPSANSHVCMPDSGTPIGSRDYSKKLATGLYRVQPPKP